MGRVNRTRQEVQEARNEFEDAVQNRDEIRRRINSTVNRELSERDGAYDAIHEIRDRVNSSRIQAERELENRIRNNVADKRQEAQEFVKNATARVNNIREDLSERVRNFIPNTKRRINETINEERQEVQEAREDLNDRINKISDNIQKEEKDIAN